MLTSHQPSTPLFFLSSLRVRTLHRRCQESPPLSFCFIWLEDRDEVKERGGVRGVGCRLFGRPWHSQINPAGLEDES